MNAVTSTLFSSDWWAAFLLSPTFAAALASAAFLLTAWVVWLRLRWDKSEAARRREQDD